LGEQRRRPCLLVRKRGPGGGCDPVRRGATGNQHQHQILGAGGIGEVERFDGRGETGRIGQRVARLDDAHAARRTAIAVTGHGDTADAAFRQATLVEIVAFGDLGHGTGSLAGRQNEQASGGGRRQMRRQAALRVRGRHRRAEQPVEKGARRCGQGSNSGAAECPRRAQVSRGPRRMGSTIIASKIAERAAACWIILRAIGARKARWKAPRTITILMAWNSQLEDPHVQAKGRAMALDDKTRTELEAAAFRRLVEHLRKRTDVQNIDLMNLAGFCRNCLSNWMKDAADARGVPMSKDESRETIYGMPYEEWKAKHQKEASKDQQAAFEKTGHKH